MQVQLRRKITASIFGVVAGLVGTLSTLSWSSYASAILSFATLLPLRIVSYPFVFPGAIITYFLVVGDNWQPSDFYRYTLPFSLAINVVAGALLGWAWRAWQQRRARKM